MAVSRDQAPGCLKVGGSGNYAEAYAMSRTMKTAGLETGSRYRGRTNPLKGPGCPPPDNKAEVFRNTKKLVPGRSFVSSYKSMTEAEIRAVVASCTDEFRAAKRPMEEKNRSNFGGCAPVVVTPEVPLRSGKSMGQMNQRLLSGSTADRVFGGYHPLEQTTSQQESGWSTLLHTLSSLGGDFPARPTTAPPKFGKRVNINPRPNSDDVMRVHRTITGTPDMKVDPKLLVRPQSANHASEVTRNDYMGARREYLTNRLKAASSNRESLF